MFQERREVLTVFSLCNSWFNYPAASPSTVSYTANALNQYTAVGAVTPTYNGNGSLTSDGTFTLGYDAENRLTSASGAGNTASYSYDAQGRRKTKTVNGTTTVFVTDAGNREVLEYDGASGVIQRWYAYGLGSNDVLNQMNVGANTRATFVPDIQGSVIALLDSGSGALSKIGYLPYGKSAGTTAPFAFTAQRIDPETNGLYYYRARMYYPAWGRFMQPDPVGYTGGGNLYGYVNNDPLNYVDPTGEIGQVAIGALAGFGVEVFFQTYSGQLQNAVSSAFGGDFGALAQSVAKIGVSTGTGALTGGISAATSVIAQAGARTAIAYSAAAAVGASGGAAKAAIDETDVGMGALYGAFGGVAGRGAGDATRGVLNNFAPNISQSFGTAVQAGVSVEGKVVSGVVQQGLKAFESRK